MQKDLNYQVTIIVTTKNEEKNIQNCLTSVKNLDYPASQIELIVVDNNSRDATKVIAKKFTNKVYNFGPERSAQRNFGIKKSKAPFFLYLDADMTLHPDLISNCLKLFKHNRQLTALYIPEIIIGNSWFSQVHRFERSFYDATVIDCVRFIRKEIIKKTGLFDEAMSGPEDWDFDKRIRFAGKVGIASKPLYHNEKNLTLLTYLQKKSYYIGNINTYIKKWGRNDNDIKKQLGFTYRYFWVFLEKGKWRRIIRHPFLALNMWILKFLVGLVYLWQSLKLNFNLRK